MSHLVNPSLLDGFLDDEPSQSAQGCFQGDDYWEIERQADKALERERALRREISFTRTTIGQLEEKLTTATERGYKRKIALLQERLEQERMHLSHLTQING